VEHQASALAVQAAELKGETAAVSAAQEQAKQQVGCHCVIVDSGLNAAVHSLPTAGM
jgi:hypothetical protein